MDVIPETLIYEFITYLDINYLTNYNTISKVFWNIIELRYNKLLEYNCHNISKNIMYNVLSRCYNLQRLRINKCFLVNDDFFKKVYLNFENIIELQINNTNNVTDICIDKISKITKSLQIINLDKCKQITDQSLISLATNCTQLNSLSIKYCSKITDNGLCYITSKRKFIYLNIGYCIDITSNGITNLDCELLKFINIECCYKIMDMAINYILLNAKLLEEINLGHCDRLSDTAFFNLPILNLQVFSLRNVTNISLFTFPMIHTLRCLNLLGCHNINEDHLVYILKNNRKLQELNLKYCNSVTKKTLQTIVEYNLDLKILNIGYCHRITYINIDLFLEKLKQITSISLYGCTYTFFYVSQYNKKIKNNLTSLDMSYCSKLTSYYLCDLIKKCNKLKELILNGVNCVNELVIDEIINTLDYEKLKFKHCKYIN